MQIEDDHFVKLIKIVSVNLFAGKPAYAYA